MHSVLALKKNINTKQQSEITKESDSLHEETQQVIENLTDLMLVAEKVTAPICPQQAPQPSNLEQAQQVLPYPLLPHNKYPTYIVWDRYHRVSVSLLHSTLPARP